MKEQEGWFQLELAEIIRVNQLVRGEIDLAGFMSWYEQLSPPEQHALTYSLVDFAYQAGVDDSVWSEVLSAAHLESHAQLCVQVKSSLEGIFRDWSMFRGWLQQVSAPEMFLVFTLAVYLFGVAEGKVYRNEKKEWCNHWWHRDLLDERVVKDILRDREFYMTSMKDDERIKGKSGWRWLRGG